VSHEDIASEFPPELVLLVLRAARFAFLNSVTQGDYEYPLQMLEFVLNVTEPFTREDFAPDAWKQSAKSVMQSVICTNSTTKFFSLLFLGLFFCLGHVE